MPKSYECLKLNIGIKFYSMATRLLNVIVQSFLQKYKTLTTLNDK